MLEQIRHNCGLCVTHTLHDAYRFIRSLQHRGREAAGLAAIGHNRIDVIKWKGQVRAFDITDLHKIFRSPLYHTYLAHVRYATKGRKDQILEDAHPHVIGGTEDNRTDHIIITDCDAVIVHNGQVDLDQYLTEDGDSSRRSDCQTGCDSEALLHYLVKHGEEQTLRDIPGAYTLAFTQRDRPEVIVLRDRHGIRPGVLGWKDGKYGVASEEVSFRKNGGEYVQELKPGSIYYIYPDGSYRFRKVLEPTPHHCFFEWIYLADIDTVLNGLGVRQVRETLGEQFAQEFQPPHADFVTFVPRCPQVAALHYAQKLGIPFGSTFYKKRGDRPFLGSTTTERRQLIKQLLGLLPLIRNQPASIFLAGKTVVIMDDSIVRGNNIRHALFLLFVKAGVKKAYVLSYTPPIGVIGDDQIPRGCLFGVDMPPGDNFIARHRNSQKIGQKLCRVTVADDETRELDIEVIYLSLAGLQSAFQKLGLPPEHLCTYCIGGCHPFREHTRT